MNEFDSTAYLQNACYSHIVLYLKVLCLYQVRAFSLKKMQLLTSLTSCWFLFMNHSQSSPSSYQLALSVKKTKKVLSSCTVTLVRALMQFLKFKGSCGVNILFYLEWKLATVHHDSWNLNIITMLENNISWKVVGSNIFYMFYTFPSFLMKTENTRIFWNIMLFSTHFYI